MQWVFDFWQCESNGGFIPPEPSQVKPGYKAERLDIDKVSEWGLTYPTDLSPQGRRRSANISPDSLYGYQAIK